VLQPVPLLVVSPLQTVVDIGPHDLTPAHGHPSRLLERRTTATVVRAAIAASSRAGGDSETPGRLRLLVSVQQANAQARRLIPQGTRVRRRRDGSCLQFGSRAQMAAAHRQRRCYRSWL
jgi:hypothetical protein